MQNNISSYIIADAARPKDGPHPGYIPLVPATPEGTPFDATNEGQNETVTVTVINLPRINSFSFMTNINIINQC